MAEHDITPEPTISKAQRRLKVGYVGIARTNPKTKAPTGYSRTPGIHLKGDWLKEAGFETGAHLTVKISDGCIVLVLYSDEVNALKHERERLRQQLREIKQANREIQNATKSALRGMKV